MTAAAKEQVQLLVSLLGWREQENELHSSTNLCNLQLSGDGGGGSLMKILPDAKIVIIIGSGLSPTNKLIHAVVQFKERNIVR